MTPIVWTYFTYLLISVSLTVWVAKTLHKNGRIFLVDAFRGNEPLADSINHLLVVGFYLINIGYVSLALGAMHFFKLLVFSSMRKRALLHPTPPPLPPHT